MADNEVKVTISGDDSQLTKTIKNSSKEIANFSTETASKVKAGFDAASKAPAMLDGAVNTSHGKIISALGSIGSKAASVGGEVGSKLAGGFGVAATGIEHMVDGAVKNLAKITVAAGTVATGLGVAFGVSAVKTFGDFEQAINEGASATDNFGGKRKDIEDLAISLGRDLPVSATDAAKGMGELGKAGFTATEILAAGPGVARLAVAAHIDIEKAAEITAGALRGFGLAASDANMVLDIMAATANASSIDVTDMSETFKYAAPAAKAAGFSIQDMSIAAGIMGNNMIKGSDAGTALRSIITRLAAPPKDAAKALDALGVSAFTADGKSKPFRDTLVDLRAKFSTLSQQEQIDMGKKIAGQEALGGFLSLMTASNDDFNKMRDSVDGSTGSLNKMVDVMNSGTKMGVENLKGSVEALQIRVGEHLAPVVNIVTGKLAELANKLAEKVDPAFAVVTKAVGKAQDKFQEILPKVQDFITNMTPLITKIFDIAQAFSPLITAFEVFKGFMSGGTQGAIDTFKERLAGMGKIVGLDLVGAFNAIVGFIQNNVVPAFGNIGSFITGTVIPAFQNFGNWITTNIGPIFGAIVNTVQNTVLPSLGKLGDFIVTQVVPKLGILLDWVGQKIVPVLEKLAAFIADPVIPVMGKIADFIFTRVVPALEKIVEVVATVLRPILEKLADIFNTIVIPALSKLIDFIGTNVIPVLSTLFDWFSTNIIPVLKVVADVVGNALANALDGMFKLWGKIADILIGAVKLAMDGIKGAINFVIDAVNLLIDGVNILGGAFGVHIDKLHKVGDAQGDLKKSTDDLAKGYNDATGAVAGAVKELDKFIGKAKDAANAPKPGSGNGGSPPAYATGTMFHPGGAAIVHAGELIQPPSGNAIYASADTFFTNLAKGSKVFTANQTEGMTQGGGGGQSIGSVTININGTGLDPKAIANEVSKQLNAQGQNTVLAKIAKAA